MQDRRRRHLPRVEELLSAARRQRACLGLTVVNDAGEDEVGVVESGAIGVDQRVANSPPS